MVMVECECSSFLSSCLLCLQFYFLITCRIVNEKLCWNLNAIPVFFITLLLFFCLACIFDSDFSVCAREFLRVCKVWNLADATAQMNVNRVELGFPFVLKLLLLLALRVQYAGRIGDDGQKVGEKHVSIP